MKKNDGKKVFLMKKLVMGFLALLMIGSMPAIFADIGDVLGPTLIGAGVGGALGGKRGAGIGAAAGFVYGAAQDRDRSYRTRYTNDDYGYGPRPDRYRESYYRQPVYQQPYYGPDNRRQYLNYNPRYID